MRAERLRHVHLIQRSIDHFRDTWVFIGQVLMFCALIGVGPVASAGDIAVASVETTVINEMLVVSAELDFKFSDDAINAIQSGVALIVDVDFRIKRMRRYIWDPKVLQIARRYRIERHALSERYVITDLVTTDRRIFDSLESSIQGLGAITAIPIAEENEFAADEQYRAAIRARLDLESLPAPLRPIAYISPSWRMSSGWHQWTLTP